MELGLLQRVVFGRNSIDELGRLAKELGGQRALLVTDPGIAQAGHVETALRSLRKQALSTFVFDGVEENPTTDHVNAGLDFARRHQPIDFMVALGGGSVMDCTKGINFLLTNGGTMEDYWGHNLARHPMLASLGIPTTAGTGSEAQPFAIIAQKKTHLKMACGDRQALFQAVILDPTLTQTMSPQTTAVTGMDAIAHGLESYVTKSRNPVSQMLAREAWRISHRNFEVVLNEPNNLTARANMLWSAHFAGTAIRTSMLGAAHACANPLTAQFGITHGVAVALMLPHVIRFNGSTVEKLYADLLQTASLSGQGECTNRLAQRVSELMQAALLPEKLRDCQVDEKSLPGLAKEANQQWTGKFNPRSLSEADYLKLYEQAY